MATINTSDTAAMDISHDLATDHQKSASNLQRNDSTSSSSVNPGTFSE